MRKVSVLALVIALIIPITASISAAAQNDTHAETGAPAKAGQLLIATTDNGTLSVDKLLYIALNRINYHVDFTCPIIIEGYNMANAGTCDGVIAGKPDLELEYENLVRVPVPLETINVYVLAPYGSPLKIDNWDELAGMSVGILENRTYILNQLPENVRIVTKTTNRAVFDGLANGEYNVAVLIERSHETLGEGSGITRVGKVDELAEYLYLNKAHGALAPELENTLKAMAGDGSYDSILWDNPLPEISAVSTVIHILSNKIEYRQEMLVREALSERFDNDASIEFKTYNLDIGHYPREQYKLTYMANLLRADCVSKNIAAIIVSGEQALSFLLDYYYLYFRNVPVLFYDISENYAEMTINEPFTGIVESIDAHETVEVALSLFPETSDIFVVNDHTPEGNRFRSEIEKQLERFEGSVKIEYNEDTDCASLMNEINGLSKNSLVLVGSYFSDVDGRTFTLSEIELLLERNCDVPIFSLYCDELAYNSVGCYISNHKEYGNTIADMLQSLLSGLPLSDIPVLTDTSSYNRWIFDMNMLDRFNINVKALPAGAVILNRSPSLWESNREFAIAMLVLVVALALIALFASRAVIIRSRWLADQSEMRQKLEIALDKTQEANDAKSKFIANISHEIRSPLNAVVGLSSLTLESDNLDNDVETNLDKIYDSGMTILSIVNDILDISKMEAGKFELICYEYDTPSLINDVIAQNILLIGEKPIKFILNIDEDLPSRLYGDELRVKQIFNNLLSNAFKYTREGIVRLSVKCYREGSDFWLIIQTQDTGIGIKEEDLSKILTDYVQVNMDANRSNVGTGLGLAITNTLVEMMDGSIDITSEYGKGSTFTAKFKQTPVSDATIDTSVLSNIKNQNYYKNKRRQNISKPRIQLPYARVLIVDDVITNIEVLKGLLKPYHMQLDSATNGQHAIDLIRNGTMIYNAIFMDHMMPDIDGMEATRRIRDIGTEYAKNIPIIAFTANAIVGNEQMFLDAGFHDFISKPVDINRLDIIVNRWVRDRSIEATFEAPAEDPQAPVAHAQSSHISELRINGLDIPKCIQHFGDDEDLFISILRSYAENTPLLVMRAKEFNNDDLAAYSIAIHSIKGSCRTIIAQELADRADKLEKAARTGDIDYIERNNAQFISDVEKFIADIEILLSNI